jgi:CRISPR-associated endonuclease/helicase Cas3
MQHYAHTLENEPPECWEPLEKHLDNVAKMASQFAAKFGAAEWGQLTGLWHDLGKYSKAFQAYLHKENGFEGHLEQYTGRVDHSTAGAQLANEEVRPWGRMLAYVIAGHHGGLTDATGGRSSLDGRLRKSVEAIDAAPDEILGTATDLNLSTLSIDTSDEKRAAFQLALFTRMIFSCLVDADFLATEAFMDPTKSAQRPKAGDQLREMQMALDKELEGLADQAADNEVGRRRQDVVAACRAATKQEPGLFTLTVPTGGGKTLASLAFAIGHAQRHGMVRVIYAIPFTSIIEQTAEVFRGVFDRLGNDLVVEHHSNVDPDAKHETVRSRLASENWDAPLVVTTNVQLFESLFASRTSRCRKLHNLAGSVIVLDEAQSLPVELLRPCLAVLRELAADYHCSIVLCTATQPAFGCRDDFPIGLTDVREIMPEPEQLYRQMKRVVVKSLGPVTDGDLVERFAEECSFLAIVNTKPHAARLFGSLQEKTGSTEGLFHLSTYLCGKHRAERIETIRQRLKGGKPCRVVSTQLIEAGVDVDFPVVFRAMTGIDSIAQAAGRCNREGRCESANVWVFEPTDVKLRGYLASVASSAQEVAPDFKDLLDPAAVASYFELHYWKQAGDNYWDSHRVMDCFPTPAQRFALDFRTAAERFRMIEDATRPVFVPYGMEGQKLTEQLRTDGPSRWLLRRLQRYTVGVYEQIYNQMVGSDVEELPDGYAVLINRDIYDEQLGLRVDRLGYQDPESLML